MSDVEHQPSSGTEAAIIDVEVAFALPDRQQIVVLKVQQGCTAYQAAELSGIAGQFAEIDLSTMKMGVFGKAVKPHDYVMHAGDRVEIYRPLIADPKASRKARADKAQTVKK
ncbi:MAG: RnfH family protein [Cellvibrionales bacterium]|jgi:putative ubiquitin-RnfH superfamily antitoxin RatB of RatAB toxin-antitoxin module|nr:RnfH family protein [Cellvibrionales bacterium]MBT5923455.1 RnfH family protein [Cellvibrionales bacterium]